MGKNFQTNLRKYADLAIKMGLNLQPGQQLILQALKYGGVPIQTAPLIRKLTASAYQFSLEGGENLSSEEFNDRGGNTSLIHEDFMIGSGEMNIDGIRPDGKTEPVMRDGEWAFKL